MIPRGFVLLLVASVFLHGQTTAATSSEKASPPLAGRTANDAPRWTVEDMVGAERILDLTVCPTDPGTVVWAVAAPDEDANEKVVHLYRTGPEAGTERVQLTRGSDSCFGPRFSPDGRRLAFLSARPTDSADDAPHIQIWLLEAGEPQPLTSLERDVEDFAWTDADHIVYLAQENPTAEERARMDADDDTIAVEDERAAPPVRLFEIEVDTGLVTRLTRNDDWIESLFVSPDGHHALTIHARSLRFEYDNKVRPRAMLTDLHTGEQRQVFADPQINLLHMAWTPDSTGLYAASAHATDPRYLNAYVAEVWHLDLASGAETPVPLDWPRGLAVDVDYFCSGGYLAATRDGFVALLADGARTRAARFTHRGDNVWARGWLEGDGTDRVFGLNVTVADDREHLHFLQSDSATPPRWYAARLERTRVVHPAAVTVTSEAWSDKPRARTELIRWKGARGDEIEGILHHPHDEQAGGPRPLVLMIHGGPFGADLDAWSEDMVNPIQLHCQRGACVLRANYHGSSGYGLEFAASIAGGPAYYDLPVEDFERAIDTLVERGLVDPKRVGVMGWSNGAILTLALLTHAPERYRAASSGAGGFEWVADTSVTAFGQSFNDYYFGAMPWEDPERYIEISPYYRADRIRTPLIIFHGDADTAVPVHHGWMQFRALQQRTNTPVRFLIFPGEEHGPVQLSHQTRKLEEELAWFDRYLYGTAREPEPWLKNTSPLAAALARAQAARVDGCFGVAVGGRLVPEAVPFEGLLVGRFEVTRAQFASFDATYPVPAGHEDFPATGITGEQAVAYARWLAATTGQPWRLPTADEAAVLYPLEAETDDGENTLDHWAGYAPNPEDAARLRERAAALGEGALLRAVGSFPGRGEGASTVFDLGGNAAEWAIDDDGTPISAGSSADLPVEPDLAVGAEPAAAYQGLRVVQPIR